MTRHVTFRASPAVVARLDELAEARGSTVAGAIRAAIVEATTPPDQPAIVDEGELLELLSVAARGGSVAAMRELRAYHRERRSHNGSVVRDSVSPLDDLAARRRP